MSTPLAGLELAYSESPRSLQGIIMGLFWFCQGLGSMFGTLVLSSFHGIWFFKWDHGDINCHDQLCPDGSGKKCSCHLDYYFFVLAALQLVGLIIFIFVSKKLGIGVYQVQEQRRSFSRQNSRQLSQSSYVQTRNGGPDRSQQNGQVQSTPSISSNETVS